MPTLLAPTHRHDADQPELIVMGCGHIGSCLVRLAAPLGFAVTAVDDFEENANPQRLPEAKRCITSFEADDLERIWPAATAPLIVIATRQHALDQRLLELCLTHPTRFLGVIGSARKARMQRERLRAKGFAPADVARVRCPVGLDIGAQTPQEIAIAIAAELVAVRNAISCEPPSESEPDGPEIRT